MEEASQPASAEVKAEESKETTETAVTANQAVETPISKDEEKAAEVPASNDTEKSVEKDSQVKSDNTPKSEKAEEKNVLQTILDKVLGNK